MTEPYEQIIDETDDQYRGFLHYRTLPSVRRSIANSTAVELGLPAPWNPSATTAKLRREHKSKKRVRESWSSANHWGARALAWDEQQARERVADRGDAVREMISRHAQMGEVLQGRAMHAIQLLDDATAAGVPVTAGFLRSDHAIIRAFELGCRIERAAYGVEAFADAEVMPAVEDRTRVPRELMLSNPAVAAASARLLRVQAQAVRDAPL